MSAVATRPSTFRPWRTFKIGGVSKEDLLNRVRARSWVGARAQELMKSHEFTTLGAEEQIATIILTPADFGYTEEPTTTELLDPTRLREWSEQHTEHLDGHVVELLPAEAGPHIREQYQDQPGRECLWTAMKQIIDSDGGSRIFSLESRATDGRRGLYADYAIPDDKWSSLVTRLVFRLRKVA